MRKRTIFFLLFIISIFGTGAIGLVWLRMEISSVAKECGELEDELEIVAREVHELRAQYSRSMRPAALASLVDGRLRMPSPKSTFHVSEEDMKRRLNRAAVVAGQKRIQANMEFAGTR